MVRFWQSLCENYLRHRWPRKTRTRVQLLAAIARKTTNQSTLMQVLFSTPEFSHSLGTKETFRSAQPRRSHVSFVPGGDAGKVNARLPCAHCSRPRRMVARVSLCTFRIRKLGVNWDAIGAIGEIIGRQRTISWNHRSSARKSPFLAVQRRNKIRIQGH